MPTVPYCPGLPLKLTAAGLALGLAATLSACGSGLGTILVPVPNQPSYGYQPQPPPAATMALLGPIDLDAFCAVNFPKSTAGVLTSSPTGWSCGSKANDDSWVVDVQQYGGNGIDLNEEAVLTGSIPVDEL
jgi:hypothetical protein